MVRSYLALLLILVCLPACQAAKVSQSYLRQYAVILKQVFEADKEMVMQLKFAARKLEQFYAVNGHLPSNEAEREHFLKVLSKYIIANPYSPQSKDLVSMTVVTAAETPSTMDGKPPPYMVPLFWLQDSTLTQQRFVDLLQHPDPSWQAAPGTIVILTDGANRYLVWAASADRLPMRNFATKDQWPVIICREITSVEGNRAIAHSLQSKAAAH